MNPIPSQPTFIAPEPAAADLTQQLHSVHDLIRSKYPFIDRVALALYDAGTDLLKTFVSSNTDRQLLERYEMELSKVPSLLALVRERRHRLIEDIPLAFTAASTHSSWLRSRGYRASYTVPIFQGEALVAFLFYDSKQPGAIDREVAEFLGTFSGLIAQLYLLQRKVVDGMMATVQIAVDLARIRDTETGEHLDRIAHYSRFMGKALAPKHGLGDEFIEYLFLFAPLHDVGKVGIPDSILLKPGRLDDAERKIMQGHVEIGERIIETMGAEMAMQESLATRVMRNIVATHHERGDGSGYPRGLVGEQIPIEGRIVAVADVYDALSSRRVSKQAWSEEEVAAEMRHEAELGRLCPDCVAALLDNRDAREAIAARFGDTLPEPATTA